jgi:hypothetical protein
MKTNVACIDLSAAYDTVLRHDLQYKLTNVIPCINTLTLIDNMLTNRRFQVFMDEKEKQMEKNQ